MMRRYKFDDGFDIFEEHPKGDLVDYDDALAMIREAYNDAWAWAGTYNTEEQRDMARERWIREKVEGKQ